jgi:hypothetical protein
VSLQSSQEPKQQTESALPGPAGYEPAGLVRYAATGGRLERTRPRQLEPGAVGLEGEDPETVDTASCPVRADEIRRTGQLRLNGTHTVSFDPDDDLILHRRRSLPFHPNGMTFTAYSDGEVLCERSYYSIGGGFVLDDDESGHPQLQPDPTPGPYPLRTGTELLGYCNRENLSVSQVMLVISGAEVGSQGEVGVASSMAAGALAEIIGGTPEQVENAAEIGMEHHLGLTCDPVGGLVQIPCIERNAVASAKAITAARLALHGDGRHTVSLDKVIKTMMETGADMKIKYKETARGGLAVNIVEC